jgi:hypothetical protein
VFQVVAIANAAIAAASGDLAASRPLRALRMPDAVGKLVRPMAFSVTVVALAVALVFELPILVQVIGPMLGDDARFYRDIGLRWLADGSYYLPHQLAGPYPVTLQLDNLYPPTALALFVPLRVLPGPLWWLNPSD